VDKTLERLAREAGMSDVTDLRRHDVGPVLQRFAALVAERCAMIASSAPLDRRADGFKDTPEQTGIVIADALRGAFAMPPPTGPEQPPCT
jgi:hypothetical protein